MDMILKHIRKGQRNSQDGSCRLFSEDGRRDNQSGKNCKFSNIIKIAHCFLVTFTFS